jgi:flagellar hook assembly protein FlgD
VSYPAGFYAVTCSTQLGTDTMPANDRMQDSVEVTPSPGVADATLSAAGARLQAKPNPSRRPVSFQVAAGLGAAAPVLLIFDAAGRCVRTLRSTGPAVLSSLSWDGRDELGRLLPGGVYFCRAAGLQDAVELVLLE